MTMTYDAEVDALYIRLRDQSIVDSVDYEEGVTLDIGEDGHPVGVEILDASKRLDDESDWPSLVMNRANVA